MQNGAMQHHLIDPRTGWPSTSDLISVTIIARTTVEAEVYAKVAFLMGAGDGLRFVERQSSLATVLVTHDGDVLTSSRLENYLDVHFVYQPVEAVAA